MLVSRQRRELSRANRKRGRVIGKNISLIGATATGIHAWALLP
jgi:hypothetical protein